MLRYVLNRLGWGLLTLFLFVSVMFFLVQAIVPADFTVQFSMGMTRTEREALREELGLNLPLWQQYLNWLRGIFTGHLGDSFYGYDVLAALRSTLSLSLFIFLPGAVLAFLIGLQLGKYTGWSAPPVADNALTLGGLALLTSFPPWLAFLLTYFVGRRIGMFRGFFQSSDLGDLSRPLWAEIELTPDQVASRMLLTLGLAFAAVLVVHWLARDHRRRRMLVLVASVVGLALCYLSWTAWGFQPQAVDLLTVAALPILTFTLLTFGETMLIMRTSMNEGRTLDYVTVARAKGLPEEVVRDHHAARNALLPVVSRLVVTLPFLITGVVIIEDVLDWPGMGTALWGSLYQQDMPMVMAFFLTVGVVTLLARMSLDVILALLDPRLRVAVADVDA